MRMLLWLWRSASVHKCQLILASFSIYDLSRLQFTQVVRVSKADWASQINTDMNTAARVSKAVWDSKIDTVWTKDSTVERGR